MNSELIQYKNYNLILLQKTYTNNYISITQYYNNIINIILKSSALNKSQQINNVKNVLAANLNDLTNKYKADILTIQNFVPKQIKINKNLNALLVGINYIGTRNQLNGCINDVNSIKDRISSKGFNINIITDLTSIKPTRDNILSSFKNLLSNSKAGDLLLFFYSGHGSNTLDTNGDERDGRDEMIVPSDLKMIRDDELKTIIQQNLKQDVTLFAMFDSCFSGSVLDLRYQYLDSLNYDNYTQNDKTEITNGNVFMISGSTDNQTSADSTFNNKWNGAMTWSLLQSLTETPNCSWRVLVKNMRDKLKKQKFTQLPQFSSGTFVNIDTPVFI